MFIIINIFYWYGNAAHILKTFPIQGKCNKKILALSGSCPWCQPIFLFFSISSRIYRGGNLLKERRKKILKLAFFSWSSLCFLSCFLGRDRVFFLFFFILLFSLSKACFPSFFWKSFFYKFPPQDVPFLFPARSAFVCSGKDYGKPCMHIYVHMYNCIIHSMRVFNICSKILISSNMKVFPVNPYVRLLVGLSVIIS